MNPSRRSWRFILSILLLVAFLCGANAHAIDKEIARALSQGDTGAKLDAIGMLAATNDSNAIEMLEALREGDLYTTAGGVRLLIVHGETARDPLTTEMFSPVPVGAEKVAINNRVRRALDSALAALKIFSPERNIRLLAAEQLQNQSEQDMQPLLERALSKEQDREIRDALLLAQAGLHMKSSDPALRLKAAQALGESSKEPVKAMLSAFLEKDASGNYAEPDENVRAAIRKAVARIDSRLTNAEYAGRIFSGVSLGSVLLLAALGLAITYGLMGVINMAHGEMLMIGAYTTYMTQVMFRNYWPQIFDSYLLLAVPLSFMVAALIGMALERGVIRYLYGRPLETLLATWGISLILIQMMRLVFGAQNVEVANPSWMSGGLPVFANLVLPYNRIVIIVFSVAVLLLVWLLLNRTRLGLFLRAVTQNRTMAGCVGVPTRKIDTWAFGLGSGIAGLGGCALSQIGNVGPELGQGYIVDSFMVVVLGGVGQIAGTVYAALGLGVMNKFLEPYAGAVLAKIFILVFIIIVIQKRPQGLFALKGRSVEQ
ncbi:MAG: urea ABC transporter permease subunit UrtB [Pseudomonadota bacterium]